MINDDISQKLDSLMKQSPFAGLSEEIRQSIKGQLNTVLKSTNLVSRDEFDAQQAVLERTLQQLSLLEKRLAALEVSEMNGTD